ncbi:MAG TPA: hypothetical protein VLG09_05205 [Candidatus Saccharimonadales bacterium]|nr:hypothetical protein [Candidatus Saccharimonadales bacterium]
MTYIYSAFVQAAFTANTDTLAIELDAAANATLKIRRIRVSHGDGTQTTSADYFREVRLITESVAGTGGVTYTPIPKDANDTASTATVKTGLATIGTVDKTIDSLSIHSTSDFFWQAADEDDKIIVKPGAAFGIVVNPAN